MSKILIAYIVHPYNDKIMKLRDYIEKEIVILDYNLIKIPEFDVDSFAWHCDMNLDP